MKKTFNKKAVAKFVALILTVISLVGAVACSNKSDSTTTANNKASKKTKLTVKQAKEIALNESKSGKVIGYEKDVDFGKTAFEITILDGQTEKEYKIDAISGKVLKVEAKDLSVDSEEKQLINASPQNDLNKVENLVKTKYPNATIKKLKLEVEDNMLVYETTVIKENKEIDAKLDANTGTFIEEEVEGYDD